MTTQSPRAGRWIGLPWRMFPSVRRLRSYARELEQTNAALVAHAKELEQTSAAFVARGKELERTNAALMARSQDLEEHLRGPAWCAAHFGIAESRLPPKMTADEQRILHDFHRMFYDLGNGSNYRSYLVSWLGYEMFKWPFDLWVYQELLMRRRPDVIIETGTYRGGSALFFASICDLLQHGEVVTVDVDTTFEEIRPKHPRITYLTGSSVEPVVVERIVSLLAGRVNVLVVLDSDHACHHVLKELRIYSTYIPPGGHLVVEDTNINGHPAYPEFGPGPWEAVQQFLSENPEFSVDPACEHLLLTANPGGFLRRNQHSRVE
jgi:cephalosporin hydroxylase